MLNAFLLHGLLLLQLAAQAPTSNRPASEPAPPPPLYRTSVDLVVMHTVVRDADGHVVAGLTKDDFEIEEEGVRQQIRVFRAEDVPVTVGLVIDHSGSMSEKLEDVIAAARTFVRSSNPRDQMFVVNFNERVSLGLSSPPLFSNQPDELESAIRRDDAVGQTALYDAIFFSLQHISTGGRDKNVLVVISDGADNASRRGLNEVLQLAGQSATLIYTIGVFAVNDVDQNAGVLKRLAQATGGQAFFPRRQAQVVDICERIAREIRSQYTLGYFSTNPVSSKAYRRIRVAAHSPNSGRLTVRTRSGYYPAPLLPSSSTRP